MCLDSFLKASKGNKQIYKSRAFHSVGAAYINERSKNELAHILQIGGTHNKQYLVWVEVLCWIDHVWFSKECGCCVCDPSVHLSVASICFVYVFVCRKLSPHLKV